MTPARPMLAEVLAALTGLPVAFWRAYDPARVAVTDADVSLRAVPGGRGWAVGPILWAYPDPAEAWEVLQARGLVPLDYRGTFYCAVCSGAGHIRRSTASRRSGTGEPVITQTTCPACTGVGHLAHPTSLPDLVAWASLGATAIATAEALGMDARHAVPKSLRHAPPTRTEWWVNDDIHADDLVECWGDGVQLKASGYVFRRRSGSLRKSMRPVAEVAELWDRGLALESINGRIGLRVPPLTPA